MWPLRTEMLLVWGHSVVVLSVTFLALILVRITVPRFRLEALSKLAWVSLLANLCILFFVFNLGAALA